MKINKPMVTTHPRARVFPRATLSRSVRVVLVAVILVALTALGSASGPLTAAAADGSALTVKWAGGNASEIQKHQPDHAALTSDGDGGDAGSGHWDDFKDLKLEVSKTKNLGNETIQLEVTGLPVGDTRKNFFQVMQCWGPDPSSQDFAETCTFGGWTEAAGSGGSTLDAAYPLMQKDVGARESGTEGVRDDRRNPVTGELDREFLYHFRSVDGSQSKTSYTVGNRGDRENWRDGIGAYFNATTSNEKVLVPSTGEVTSIPFEVQNAAVAPHLGCGDDRSKAGERCWLVVVPRGNHSGEKPGVTKACDWIGQDPGYGKVPVNQAGSPLDPQCTYWQDRIVVPLDFDPAYQSCRAGAAERRVTGSELIAEAISSWQSALCIAPGGAAYSVTTNSGNVTRSQLLTGQADFAVVADPLTPENIGGADPALLEDKSLEYAPLTNSALVIGFLNRGTEDNGSVIPEDKQLKLTPRLLAKMLTQSYQDQIPWARVSFSEQPGHLLDPGRPFSLADDPEWKALGNSPGRESQRGAFVTPGPAGDDAIGLLWRYVQADAEAAAFLRGEPDSWGMTINPTYRQADDPAAVGPGLDVDVSTAPIDTFLRADPSVSPDRKTAVDLYNGQQTDSITQLPYSQNLSANATRIFRADTKYTAHWDPQKFVAPGVPVGAYVPDSPKSIVQNQFILGPADAASAERMQLRSAALQLPNKKGTFVTPTEKSITAAVNTQALDPATGASRTDFTRLPEDGYPLATTLYGAVDVASAKLNTQARKEYAALLDYAAGDGQTRGERRGQLPAGYAPLTQGQRDRASELAATLRLPQSDVDETPGDGKPGSGDGPGSGDRPGSGDGAAPGGGSAPGGGAGAPAAAGDVPATQTGQTINAAQTVEVTSGMSAVALRVVGAALVAALVGLAAGPLLLRRRGAP